MRKLLLLLTIVAASLTGLRAQNEETIEAPKQVDRDSTNYRIEPSIINLPLRISTHRIGKTIAAELPNPLTAGDMKANLASLIAVDGTNALLGKAGDAIENIPWVGTFFGQARDVVSASLWDPLVQAVRDHINYNVPLDAQVKYNVFYDFSWIKVQGNHMIADIYLSFDLKTDVEVKGLEVGVASCGINEERPQIKIMIAADLTWENDAKLRMDNRQWYIDWTRPCKMTMFNLDMESLLNLPFIKTAVNGALDNYMNQTLPNDVVLKGFIQDNWTALTAPQEIPVDNFESKAWLKMNVFGLSFGPIWGENDTLLNTIVSIYANPEFVLSKKAPEATPTPVPPIYVVNNPDNRFRLYLTATMPIEDLEKTIDQQLKDPDVMDDLPKKMKITKIRLYGTGNDSCVIGITMKKPFKGEVFLEGKPAYDPLTNQISFPDLDFSIKTKNVLVNTAEWLFHEKMCKKLKSSLKTSMKTPVESIHKQIERMDIPILDYVNLKAQVDTFIVRDIWFTRSEVKVLLEAAGAAYLDVH